ncbi:MULTISPECIES: hypothetical protein [Floridanema]|uniref:Uncharacterized protein n=2 Tax=Floridanema TaxID=3396149 RepID=A0ABV4Y0R0_9CYAN
MAKLPRETTETVLNLKRQLIDILDEATATEFVIFESFGETDETLPFLDEMKSVAEQATSRFSQLSALQLRIGEAQPNASADILELLAQGIAQTQQRIPAWERSIQEVKLEWNLP